ncbi:hypothetical protein HUU62_02210 [Rhodoferax sp. 4810]|nr:hypothetical protein [Rhodoferax jenense]
MSEYESQEKEREFSLSIKWSRNLKRRFAKNLKEPFNENLILKAAYRPYSSLYLYNSNLFIDESGSNNAIFPPQKSNKTICFSNIGARTNYVVLAVKEIADLHFGSSVDTYQQLPFYYFDESGTRSDNITDWALEQFTTRYQTELTRTARALDKPAIFHYCYAVLHDPIYRDKYALNLKRDFPRIPFYSEFWRWVDWGAALLDLHLNYEQTAPFPFTRIDTPDDRARAAGVNPKVVLRADVNNGSIRIDSETTLFDIPATAWTYQLGNRCAIEWILDQYKEKTPKDPTIRARFNTYRFADYKETVIELIARVTTVSIETMQIVNAMRELGRD